MKKDGDNPTLNIGSGTDTYGDVRLDLFPNRNVTVVGDGQHLPFRQSVFRKVHEKNLLEHLPNPGLHLLEVKRVLQDRGVLRLITDNAACLKYYLLGTHTGGYRKHRGKDRHFALFTKEHMENLMELCNFQITGMSFIDTDYPTRYFDKVLRLVVPSLSYPRIQVEATKS